MNFVTVMTFGAYDEHTTTNIYAGTDYETAKSKALTFVFPDSSNTYGYVEHWQDGTKIKEELVRE